MPDDPPFKRRALSTEHARVPVVTTRSHPSPDEASPEALVVLGGTDLENHRRAATARAGVPDAAPFLQRDLPLPVSAAPTLAEARRQAAALQAQGIPAQALPIDHPLIGTKAPQLAAAVGLPLVAAIPLLILFPPLGALLLAAAVAIGVGVFATDRSRGREMREALRLRDEQRAPTGPLDARILAQRRRVVESELPEGAQRDLFEALGGLLGLEGEAIAARLDQVDATLDALSARSADDRLESLTGRLEQLEGALVEAARGAGLPEASAGEDRAERQRRAAQARRQREGS